MKFHYKTSSASYYANGKTQALTAEQLRDVRDAIADGLSDEITALVKRYTSGAITLEQWASEFASLLRVGTTAGYALGHGGVHTIDGAVLDRIDQLLADQHSFAEGFIRDLGAGNVSDAQMDARAQLYAGQAVKAYEEARSASFGVSLPCYPGDGGTQCVVNPHARVLTERGLVPIADVRIGDWVMTHRGRLRPVTDIIRSLSRGKTFARMSVHGHKPVTFTRDHKLFSASGWNPVDGIMHEQLQVLTIDGVRYEVSDMFGLRNAMRSPRETVPIMRQPNQGKDAMVGPESSRNDDDVYAYCRRRSPLPFRGSVMGLQLADQAIGRAPVSVVLGRRPPANDLSLSMGVDHGEWAYTERASYSPQIRGQDGRPTREFGMPPAETSWRDPYDSRQIDSDGGQAWRRSDRADAGYMRDVRQFVSHQGQGSRESLLLATLPNQGDADNSELRDVWEGVRRGIGSWQTPEVLQSGVLPDETILYDITVAEDHSFVVEGIVAHNCLGRCRCYWVITDSEDGNTITADWRTQEDGEVCNGCYERAQLYSPYVQMRGA